MVSKWQYIYKYIYIIKIILTNRLKYYYIFIFLCLKEVGPKEDEGSDDDDMVLVPQEVWDKETNYTSQNLRQINQNISNACVGIKLIYNRGWVRSAGNGNAKLAVQRLLAVLAEVQEIYGTKFTERNTLGVYVKIEMIGGSILTTGVSLAKKLLQSVTI